MRVLILAAAVLSGAAEAERPNVVFVLVDDMGWRDLGCYGRDTHRIPHIDRLASQGVRFSQAYAPATVCPPTRAALLTGQSLARHLGIVPKGPVDGIDLTPVLEDPGVVLRREVLHWPYPTYHPGTEGPHSVIRAREWKKRVGAQSPTKNPDYDPAKATVHRWVR